jgi:hypothetical protein
MLIKWTWELLSDDMVFFMRRNDKQLNYSHFLIMIFFSSAKFSTLLVRGALETTCMTKVKYLYYQKSFFLPLVKVSLIAQINGIIIVVHC